MRSTGRTNRTHNVDRSVWNMDRTLEADSSSTKFIYPEVHIEETTKVFPVMHQVFVDLCSSPSTLQYGVYGCEGFFENDDTSSYYADLESLGTPRSIAIIEKFELEELNQFERDLLHDVIYATQGRIQEELDRHDTTVVHDAANYPERFGFNSAWEALSHYAEQIEQRNATCNHSALLGGAL